MPNSSKIHTASIISIGTEIIYGHIDDTNATFLCKQLKEAGIKVVKRTTVDDSIDKIVQALDDNRQSDIVFLTGGLGPTHDDITRDAVAKFLGRTLIFSEKQWEKIAAFFVSKNIVPAASNKRQAYLIEGGQFIENKQGTAPGLFVEDNGRLFFLLPGPPRENQPIMRSVMENTLNKRRITTSNIKTKSIRIYNTGESALVDLLKDKLTKNYIGIYFKKEGWIEIQVTKINNGDACLFSEIDEICLVLNEHNIPYTEDRDLPELLLESLTQKELTIAFAESITGGLLSSTIVSVPGASGALLGGVVAYNNTIKSKVLGVKESTLKTLGAVSPQTASEMAQGLKKLMGSDIAVSVSGIAGPTGGTDAKPIGTVFFGFLFKDSLVCKKKVFFGNRRRIIKKCVNFVYLEVLDYLVAL